MATAKPWMYFSMLTLLMAASLSHATLSGAERQSNYVEYGAPIVFHDLSAKNFVATRAYHAGQGAMVSSKKKANGNYSMVAVYPASDAKTVYCRSSESRPGFFYPAFTDSQEHVVIAARGEAELGAYVVNNLLGGITLEECLKDISTQSSGYVCYSTVRGNEADIVNIQSRKVGVGPYETVDICRQAAQGSLNGNICASSDYNTPGMHIYHNGEITNRIFADLEACNKAILSSSSTSTADASAGASRNDGTAEAAH